MDIVVLFFRMRRYQVIVEQAKGKLGKIANNANGAFTRYASMPPHMRKLGTFTDSCQSSPPYQLELLQSLPPWREWF